MAAVRVTEDQGHGEAKLAVRVIDGDGHLFEDADGISQYLPSPYREAGPWPMIRLFPPLDHLHVQIGQLLPGSFGGGKPVGPRSGRRS